MTRERILDLVDLVLAANYQFEQTDSSAAITLDLGRYTSNIYVHENIGGPGSNMTVYSDAPESEYCDPALVKAEFHIRKIMEVKDNAG